MHSFSQKILVVLLSLLLGLLPLQGVFAADASMHDLYGMNSSLMTDVMNHHQMNMAQQCDQCEQNSCCSGSSCEVDHCASCAYAAVLPETMTLVALPLGMNLMTLEPAITSFSLNTLYRPPRA